MKNSVKILYKFQENKTTGITLSTTFNHKQTMQLKQQLKHKTKYACLIYQDQGQCFYTNPTFFKFYEQVYKGSMLKGYFKYFICLRPQKQNTVKTNKIQL